MIKIIVFGKIKDKNLKGVNDEFVKRMSKFPFLKTNIIEWKDDSVENEMKKIEEYIIESKKNNEKIILLDELGKDFSTIEFKNELQGVINEGEEITFFIGGPEGFPNNWKKEIKEKYSVKMMRVSAMVFTHEMARILLLEQIYRVGTIEAGIPYHKA